MLGVYERPDRDRVRAHARRVVALAGPDWPPAREVLHDLVRLARARGATRVALVARASLKPARRRRVIGEAGRLRCDALAPTAGEELRWLFLGAVRDQRAADGLVAEVEPSGLALARWRGRVLASTARVALKESPASSGIRPGRPQDALVVTGSLAADLLGQPVRSAPCLTRAAVARSARGRGPRAAAAAALRRLMEWTGQDAAAVAPHALVDGLAATLLEAPIPPGR